MQNRVIALFLSLSVVIWLAACDRLPASSQPVQSAAPQQSLKSEAQAARERSIEDCRVNIQSKKASYAKLMAETKYWEASTALRHCANVLEDKALEALVNNAELKSTWKDIKSAKVAPGDRLRQIEALRRDWPEEAKKDEGTLNRIALEAKKLDDAASAAAKRRSGILIGMTAEDVLASSWGRPERVNRTISARGTSEQWVYGGRNYLYFENGVLTTIQN